MVLAAIAFGLVSAAPVQAPSETYELPPSDDAWVYPHADDPSRDPFLRVWGSGGRSVDEPGRTPEDFSYAYLRFDLSPLPKRVKVLEAALLLTHVPNPSFSAADAERAPLEVRPLAGDFTEKGWNYADSAKVHPDGGKDALLGAASPKPGAPDKEFGVTIDLLKLGRLPALLTKALEGERPALRVALTSALDPSEAGNRAVYKVYSKDGPKEFRPTLRLVVERIP